MAHAANRRAERKTTDLQPVQDGAPELFAPRSDHRRQARPGEGPGRDQGAGDSLLGVVPGSRPDGSGSKALDALKEDIDAAGVTVIGYGVVHFGNDADANRRTFEFAKAPGDLSIFPPIPIPLASTIWTSWSRSTTSPSASTTTVPATATTRSKRSPAAIKDHHPKIGCCIDTGHFLRSKVDPVDAVEAFGNRVYGVHLKDVKDAKTFTVLGKGDLRTVDLLKALARNKYSYCLAIEYEEKPENPVDDIKACLAEAARAIAEVRKA